MTDRRMVVRRILAGLLTIPEARLSRHAAAGLTPDSRWSLSAPLGDLAGVDAILEGFVLPLRRALTLVSRRDEIVITGSNRRGGGDWVAATTHYVGTFDRPLFGIAPHRRVSFLRAGEFYRLDGSRIAEAKLIVDLIDLLRQTGASPVPHLSGAEILYPGPATHDGVCPPGPERSEATLDLVEAMLDQLHAFDPQTFTSAGQTGPDGFWAERMLWYGPAGVGSTHGHAGFLKDHRIAFLTAFPDRIGGNHYCRIGDGDYAAVSGWPSMTMTHQGPYLGIAPSGRALTLRVMDFYRCGDGRIQENWVYLDYVDLLAQMGVDVMARADAD